MPAKKQIAIVDPHPVTILGLTYLLESTNQFEVVVREVNSDKGFFQIVEQTPDIVIMELELEGRGAITLADDITSRLPATRLMFYSGFLTDVFLHIALELNVAAFLDKSESYTKVLEAVQLVATGKRYFSPTAELRLHIDNKGKYSVPSQSYLTSLTLRQIQVLRHLVRGESVKEVARAMRLSERAVESHKYRIMQKLEIHDRVELTRYAIREGLMPA